MKVRMGFVSNSSSSSFVCAVTGQIEAGYDLSLEDAGMCNCVNDHCFSEERLVYNGQWITYGDLPEGTDSDDYNDGEDRWEIPAENCPICTLHHIGNSDVLTYLSKVSGIDINMIKDQIRGRYEDYKKFTEELR